MGSVRKSTTTKPKTKPRTKPTPQPLPLPLLPFDLQLAAHELAHAHGNLEAENLTRLALTGDKTAAKVITATLGTHDAGMFLGALRL